MENQRRNHVAIEMNEEVLAKAKPVFTTECCIYRVPRHIRNLNPGAYTPNVVSIGPFHYGKKKFKSMESQKQFYCHKFIERAETTFDKLMSCVQELEPSVRACYSHNIKLTPQELVKVILVDCGFIFQLFLINYWDDWTDDDAIPLKPWLSDLICMDLVSLENQLPFFVLEKLYDITFENRRYYCEPKKYPSFRELTFHYFEGYNKWKLSAAATTSIEHFTDLLRTFYLQPSGQLSSSGNKTINYLNSATELNEAGVEFEVNKQSHCLLNLNISKDRLCYLVPGTLRLEIPELKVDDWTEILFRNIIALEQCHYPYRSCVTDYVTLMGYLIKTGKDVDLLAKKKIIANWSVDSDAVAKMFNDLCKNITEACFNSEYVAICEKLNTFCEHPWYSGKATLKRDYCSTRWKTFASFAAILVIILTIIQTVCSFLQVVQY